MKIYTRTGDKGETSLFGGTRVRKSDARVAAYGEVDELNASLGVARSAIGDRDLDAERHAHRFRPTPNELRHAARGGDGDGRQ